MKKWISSTVILLSSVCLPLSLIGSETLDWGIIGIGGGDNFNEKAHPLKRDPLMAATQRRAAEKVNTLTQVIFENGTIQPTPGTGAYFEWRNRAVNNGTLGLEAADIAVIVFPDSGTPKLSVNQIIPQNYDVTKPATVTFTFNSRPLPPSVITQVARFKLGILVPNQPLRESDFLELTISQKSASINTLSLKYTVPARATRRVPNNTLVQFILTRYNGHSNNFIGDLEFIGYQVEYTPAPQPVM